LLFLILSVRTCLAQYDPNGLFQFSIYWQQEPANETGYDLNLDPGPIIDESDLLLLIQGWRSGPPTPTPTPTPPKEITIDLPGLPVDATPLEMVLIPAGSFMMGSNDDSDWSWCYPCEQPVHEVTIGYDFYMGKFEVTQAQWQAVMGSNPSYNSGDDHPVDQVSWNDCQNFVTELNKLGQGTFRLPSEAEWEHACRAGATTRFYFGDSDGCGTGCEDCAAGVLPGNLSDYMWYCVNNGPSEPQSGTKPGGEKLPNDFGLYDTHGNVWEWCEDDWHSGYTNAPDSGLPWVDSPRSAHRVVRGGSHVNNAQSCRSSYRGLESPGGRYSNEGLRLVRVAP